MEENVIYILDSQNQQGMTEETLCLVTSTKVFPARQDAA